MINYQTTLDKIKATNLNGFFVGWAKPLSQRQHYQTLQNSSHVVLAVDTKTNQVIGFINALSDHINTAYIPLLEVLPDYQHKGIGTVLVKKMLEELSHLRNIDLMCDQNMVKFYKQFNMHETHGMIIRN